MNSQQIHEIRSTDPSRSYQLTVLDGEGLYVWFESGKFHPVQAQDYDTLEGLRHGCGSVSASFKAFDYPWQAAEISTPLPNALADAYLADISREQHGVGLRYYPNED
jgi:hypothetical protein